MEHHRPSKTVMFWAIAWVASHRAHCRKAKVGCVITDLDGQQVAIGYNGLAAGGPNDCFVLAGRCSCVHAEANALLKAHWPGPKIAYVTLEPCETCSNLLRNAGVVEVHVLPTDLRRPVELLGAE